MRANSFTTRLLLLINVPIIAIAINLYKNDFQRPSPGMFPELKGETLEGRKVVFPTDLDEEVNILILAFEQKAQPLVNTWANLILDEYEPRKGVSYYEIPMISTLYLPIAWQIDNWMRDGIPAHLHDNTVTFYGHRSPYFEMLEIEDKESCYLFVVDRRGNIKYRTQGPVSEYNEASFREAMTETLLSKGLM